MAEVAPTKVLILTEHAAASRYFIGVVRELRDRGAEVIFATVHPEGPLHRVLGGDGSTALSLEARRRSLYPVASVRLKKILAGLDPSFIVHAHEVLPAAVAVVTSRVGAKNRVVFHRHHTIGGRSHRGLSRWVARRSDLVVTVSSASARCALRDDGVKPGVVRSALNGIDAPAVDSVASLTAADHPLVVGVGRMRTEKGFEDLIRAMRPLQTTVAGARLLLVGDGPERSHLELLARALEVDCRFVGWVDDPFPYLRAADVVAVPSRREAFGIAAIEAMAMARPVVASPVGGLPEVIEDGKTGRLTTATNPVALAGALEEILTQPALAQRLGRGARRSYEDHFTAGAMAERWLDCYEALRAPVDG